MRTWLLVGLNAVNLVWVLVTLWNRLRSGGLKRESAALYLTPVVGVLLIALVIALPQKPRPPIKGNDEFVTEHLGTVHLQGPHHPLTPKEALEKAISESVAPGKVMWNPPKRMLQSTTQLVEVRVTKSMLTEVSMKWIPEGKEIFTVAVGPFMTVRLVGSGYQIKPLMPEEQFVSKDSATPWTYEVTALDAGVRTLFLTIGTRLKINGKDEVRFAPAFSKAVTVDRDIRYSASRFLEANWQWVSGSLLIPPIIFFLSPWLKRRLEKKRESRIITLLGRDRFK